MSVKQHQNLLKQYIDSAKFPLLYAHLIEHGTSHHFHANKPLFRQGDMPNKLAILISGQVEISYIDDVGNYVIVEKCGEGFWYGDAAYIDGNPLPYTAKPLTEIIEISLAWTSLQNQPQLELELYKFISHNLVDRLRVMYYKFDTITTKPLQDRVIERLQQLQDKQGEVKLTHDELAFYLSVSRHKVSRMMKKLEADNILKQGYGKIKLLI